MVFSPEMISQKDYMLRFHPVLTQLCKRGKRQILLTRMDVVIPLKYATEGKRAIRLLVWLDSHTQFSHTQSFSVPVSGNMLVQQFRSLHVLHMGDQQRDIIYVFYLYAQDFFHALKFTSILRLRPDLSER
jgi:hypothetical protein